MAFSVTSAKQWKAAYVHQKQRLETANKAMELARKRITTALDYLDKLSIIGVSELNRLSNVSVAAGSL